MHGGTKAREAINQRFLVMIPSDRLQASFPVEVPDTELDPRGSSSWLGALSEKNIVAMEMPPSGMRAHAYPHFMTATAHRPSPTQMMLHQRPPTVNAAPSLRC
jgi:hypothetical protein